MDAKDCSRQKVYLEFRKCLDTFVIPVTNISEVASDGAPAMIGRNNSFFSHLKKDVPNVVLFKCLCPSTAIVSYKACLELPRRPEQLLQQMYNYIATSKRPNKYQKMI